jgi:hypothetical protein
MTGLDQAQQCPLTARLPPFQRTCVIFGSDPFATYGCDNLPQYFPPACTAAAVTTAVLPAKPARSLNGLSSARRLWWSSRGRAPVPQERPFAPVLETKTCLLVVIA